MGSNQLTYIQHSKEGVLQIQWLSELLLLHITIEYKTGYSSKATDALSYCPFNPDSDHESKTDSDEVE